MTREEAIGTMNYLKHYAETDTTERNVLEEKDRVRFIEAVEMAIKVLSQEPCDDVVSREAVISKIQRYNETEGGFSLINSIKELPSVTQKPNFCASCKHNTDNEICLECEYDGITRGMTRYEPVTQKSGKCKTCKYWQDNNDGYPSDMCKWRTDKTPDADDFCSGFEPQESEDKE